MERFKPVWAVLALAFGVVLAAPQVQAALPPTANQHFGHKIFSHPSGPDRLDIMPKGYSLTKGRVFGRVAGNTLLNAQTSPLNDPYAPIVNGVDAWASTSCTSLNSDCYTMGSYYGPGPVMQSQRHIYLIWYGNWQGNSALTIIPQFVQLLNMSPYEWILSTYQVNNRAIMPSITFGGQTFDDYSLGQDLSDANIQTIVQDAINEGRLPLDNNGIYFVLTSPDVMESSNGNLAQGGFCTAYCGWHSDGLQVRGVDVKYGFVGDGEACASQTAENYGSWPGSCIAMKSFRSYSNYVWNSPNNNPGADGMVSVLAHESEEATTDPEVGIGNLAFYGYDWWSGYGYENGDQCAWRFGAYTRSMYTTANGSLANMNIRGYNYLIQKNVVIVDPQGIADYGILENTAYGQFPTNWWNWYEYGMPAVGGTADYCGLSAPTYL